MKRTVIIISFFLLWNIAFAQTRMYMTGNMPTFTVAAHAKWLKTAPSYPNDIWQLSSTYHSNFVQTLQVTVADSTSYGAYPHYMQIMQYLTLPLTSQTLNGTVHIQIRAGKSTGSSSLQTVGIIFIRLVSPDGTIAKEIDSISSPNILSGTLTNYYWDYTFNNLVIQSGQMICFDMGSRIDKGVTTSNERFWKYYAANTTDLPVDLTTTTALNNWIEFSQVLKFQYQSNFF